MKKSIKTLTLLSRWRFEEEAQISGEKNCLGCGLPEIMVFLWVEQSLHQLGLVPGYHWMVMVIILEIPHFRGLFEDGNFTLSAWFKLDEIGVDSDIQDAAIFGTNGNGENTPFALV